MVLWRNLTCVLVVLLLVLMIGDGLDAQEATPAKAVRLEGEIVDAATGQALPARVYLRGEAGDWHFVASADPKGSAVTYDKTNWINARAVEKHTTLSGHPFYALVPPGNYQLTVERGKEYFPANIHVAVKPGMSKVRVPLKRWVNMAERGWYSGETHLHRKLEDLPNVMLAEDLNVGFPLTYWVTQAYTPPTAGNKNLGGVIPDRLIEIDKTHVIWPRNTEYEIFTVGPKQHTLGAIFMLNHKSVFTRGIPPVAPVAKLAADEGAMFDIDKPDWPFALTLLSSAGPSLFELTNNHVWRTEFGFNKWISETPGYLQPPRGGKGGSERDWIHYTLGVYYTLLDAGYRLVPTAGTANGVHPVPAGFGRVYVHQPNGFSYDGWVKGLREGKSMVTTGPMLFTQIVGQQPGASLRFVENADMPLKIEGSVLSEHPLAFIEVIANGQTVQTIHPQNKTEANGARSSVFSVPFLPKASGWVAVRCFEDRPDGRVRFAHTAPWWIEVPGKPLRPTAEEKNYLVKRVRDEMARSKEVLAPEAIAEYSAALKKFEALETQPVDQGQVRKHDENVLRDWLENMVAYHGYTIEEVMQVTGLPRQTVREKLDHWKISFQNPPARKPTDPLVVLPFPGGRHPRTGFRDGAIQPQRETKVSIFAPWDSASYAVVDVPEAIWSNLGLTYLAHTHVPTIWDKANVRLPQLEWVRSPDGALMMERTLPNQIRYGSTVRADQNAVRMELWIRNGTKEKLTGLRAQICVMLQGLTGFHAQTATNKITRGSAIACRDEKGDRWIATAWQPLHRVWNNPPVPCLHTDPSFPDCEPGQTVRARGVLIFHEGPSPDPAFARLQQLLNEK